MTDAIWQNAPWPALRVQPTATPPQVQPNAAARAWALLHGWELPALEQVAQRCAQAAHAENTASTHQLANTDLLCTAHRQGDGTVIVWPQLDPSPPRGRERRVEDVWRRALILAEVIVWRIDLATRRVHYNDLGFAALGRKPDPQGVSIEHLQSLIHPQDADSVALANQRAMQSDEVVDLIARYRFADGQWRHQLTRHAAERDDRGRVIAVSGVAVDVTQLQRQHQHVMTLHEQRALAAQAMGAGFWRGESALDGSASGLQWDEPLCAIYGCTPDAAPTTIGQWLTHVHEDDRGWVDQRLQMAAKRLEPLIEMRYRITDGQGRLRWVNGWSTRFVRQDRLLTFGMEMDVTASQESRHEQQRTQQRQQFAIDAAAVGIWERDATGHVVFWNPHMYPQHGCDVDDAREPDTILAQATMAEDQGLVQQNYLEHVATGQAWRAEYRSLLPDGSSRWLLAQGRPLRDASGRVVGMAGVNLDITARKSADLLSAETQRAWRASRDKSAFMARMSHELRTPLNAVLGFARLLIDDTREPLTDTQRERVDRIDTAGQRLLSLSDRLLDISRQDPAEASGSVLTETLNSTDSRTPGGESAPAAPSPGERSFKLLCVEDNPVNLLLVQELLTMRPQIELRCAENGQSAVEEALRSPPDAILLDLQLPDISGHEVHRQLRQAAALRRCRFIALSADALPESIASTLAAGFDDYWTKPINFDAFLKGLDRLMAEAESLP